MEVSKIFAENSPEQIKYAVQNGLAPKLWNIGDTIQVRLKGKIESLKLDILHTATIIGFSHNAAVEGTNTLHLCFKPLCDKSYLLCGDPNIFSHQTTNTGQSGWEYSNIRRNILPQFKNCLPQSWQDIITPCTKYTDNAGLGVELPKYVSPTHDEVWLLSEYEVFGEIEYSNTAEAQYQQQYEYFKTKKEVLYNTNKQPIFWWLRSPYVSYAHYFCYAIGGGSSRTCNADYSLGIAPCIQIS